MGVVLSTVLQLCCLKVNVANKRRNSLRVQKQQWSTLKAKLHEDNEKNFADLIYVISNFHQTISVNFLLFLFTEVIPKNASSLRILHEYDRADIVNCLGKLTTARIGKIVNHEFQFRQGYQELIKNDKDSQMVDLLEDCLFVMRKTLTAHNGFSEEFVRDTVVHGLEVWRAVVNNNNNIVEKFGDFPATLCEKLLYFGNGNEVIALVAKTEDVLVHTFGSDHMYVLKLYFNEASAFYLLGNFEDCLNVTTNLLEITSTTIGFENSFSLKIAHLTGKVLEKLESYQDALELYNDIFQVEIKKYRADDKRTLSTLHHRANILHKLKVLQESLDLYQNLLKLQESMFSNGDSIVLNTKARIGLLQEEQGKFTEAFKMYKEIQDAMQCSSQESEKSSDNLKTRNESTISLLNYIRRQNHEEPRSSTGFPNQMDKSDNFIHLHEKLEGRLREEIQLCRSKLIALGMGDERVIDTKSNAKNVNKSEQIRTFLNYSKEIWNYCTYFGSISQEFSTFPNQLLEVMQIYGCVDDMKSINLMSNVIGRTSDPHPVET